MHQLYMVRLVMVQLSFVCMYVVLTLFAVVSIFGNLHILKSLSSFVVYIHNKINSFFVLIFFLKGPYQQLSWGSINVLCKQQI